MSFIDRVDSIRERFRGYLPVVVDVETGGFNHHTDALLEAAAVVVEMDEEGRFVPGEEIQVHMEPFEGANIEPRSLEVNGIDPWSPLRGAVPEKEGLKEFFRPIRRAVRTHDCKRAILVGHNAAFDRNFLTAAVNRTGIKRDPFHPFSTFDTVSLSGLVFGETVLARAVKAAGLEWDHREAHCGLYDAQMTAQLFCRIVNGWQALVEENSEELEEA